MFGVSLHEGRVITDGGYAPEWLLKCCVQSICIESVFHHEHYSWREDAKKSVKNIWCKHECERFRHWSNSNSDHSSVGSEWKRWLRSFQLYADGKG